MNKNTEFDFSPESRADHNELAASLALFAESAAKDTQPNSTANNSRFPSPFGRPAESERSAESRLEVAVRSTEIEKKVEWAANLSDGFRRAMSEGKPLVMVFGADWCDKCTILKREVIGQPKDPNVPGSEEIPASREFNNFSDRAIFVYANPEKDDRFGNVKQKIQELGIESIPTMVILEVPSMQERARITGRWPKDVYVEKMNEAFKGKSDAPVKPSRETSNDRAVAA